MREAAVFRSILVGDDGTESSRAAVEAALSLAACMHAKLVLLGILESPSPTEEAEGWGLDRLEREHAQMSTQLEADAQRARAQGVEASAVAERGDVGKQMKRYCTAHAVDLVVLGHHDVSRPRRWLEGSTQEELARSLHVSVLLVEGSAA